MKILKYPDPILRKRTMPVEKISKDIFQLVDKLTKTMFKEDGLGLAANQVGFLLRIFVINASSQEDIPKPIVMINPKILNQGDPVHEEEGCLSFPGLYLRIQRYNKVRVHAKNLYNEDLIYETEGILARAIQHEMDHLNGILFIDHAGKGEAEKVKEFIDNLDFSLKER